MKKLKLVLLLVTIVSSRLFAQDFHVKSSAYGLAHNNKKDNMFYLESKLVQETDIYFTKNNIEITDQFNTCLNILRKDTFLIKNANVEVFVCKDNDGYDCLFFLDKDLNSKPYYLICYDNFAYFYYVKN